MLTKEPWWWPAVGVALGLAVWITMACIWVAVMAALYGVYVWFGGKALLAFVGVAIAAVLHFQIKDIEQGRTGNVLMNMLLRWIEHRSRGNNGT